jgi:magnesium transporter
VKIYDYAGKNELSATAPPDIGTGELFIVCRASEIPTLRETFGWDESTVLECANLDESVRYSSYDGYDFVSLVHMELDPSKPDIGAPEPSGFALREINMYVSERYLTLVLPERHTPKTAQLEAEVLTAAKGLAEKAGRLNRLYFLVLSKLLGDFSDMLERLEDNMEALSEEITKQSDQNHLTDIGRLRRAAYAAKKQLRALSYLGAQILMDENNFIDKKHKRYFHSAETRMKKLYDFAESLYEMSGELLHTHDSKLTVRMNDTMNKLTLLTLFFGPLTVITGVYGMNFDVMPELRWPFGYPLTLGLMAGVSLALYLLLKKNKWM